MRGINGKKEIFTIPNFLSIFRLALVPIYTTIYLNAKNPADYYLAAGILAASCFTDLLDGQIARRFHMISTVGKVLDPVADKVTQLTLVLCLALRHQILWMVLILTVIKDLFQLIAGIIALRHGRILKGALFSGKLCTTVLFISLIVLVMLPEPDQTLVNCIAIIDEIFLIIAFGDYLMVYLYKDRKFQSIDKKET